MATSLCGHHFHKEVQASLLSKVSQRSQFGGRSKDTTACYFTIPYCFQYSWVFNSGTKKRGFLEGGFCKMYASLGSFALSAQCTAGPNILGYFLFPWPWHWACNLRGHLQRCRMPDIENSRKTAEKGAEWVTVKQPKNSRKNSRNTRKTAVFIAFRLFFGCFGCFSGCFSAVLPWPTRHPFRLFFGCFPCRAFGTSVGGREIATLGSTETPFAKTPLSWFLNFGKGGQKGELNEACRHKLCVRKTCWSKPQCKIAPPLKLFRKFFVRVIIRGVPW